MIQIFGIAAASFVGMYMIYIALHIGAALTFNGKIRFIDKFIGFFDEGYMKTCIEFIEAVKAYSETGRHV